MERMMIDTHTHYAHKRFDCGRKEILGSLLDKAVVAVIEYDKIIAIGETPDYIRGITLENTKNYFRQFLLCKTGIVIMEFDQDPEWFI